MGWFRGHKQYFSYRHDMHAHLLPGLDDGVKTLEEALKLLEKMRGLGIERFSLTPHVAYPSMPNTGEDIQTALAILQKARPDIPIEAGAEYRVGEEVFQLAEEGKMLPFHQQYILIENSFLAESIHLESLIFLLRSKGFIPVLAHPERYKFYYSHFLNKCQDLIRKGCLLQLNLLSLAGFYGKETEKIAWQLLKSGMVSFVGSDVHHLNYAEALEDFLYSRTADKLNSYTLLNR
ncbi:CpsB/CapC family capsule biosynthesis tyrosine phosphatase [uncultured Odoribacter sp.]|uniref:tyrosine-protein phosphatase n=1 Tax=uncultured Odoribacter sp. TaxID=876416 RepID=UPI002618EF37|nr:CpsB/CapC family capsule biosynthesis tyrosine phosphatase [uncultured Odoribacter sp.]